MNRPLAQLIETIARHPVVVRLADHVTGVTGCSLQLMQPLGDNKHAITTIGEPRHFIPCETVGNDKEGLTLCWRDCDAAWQGPVPGQIKVFTCHAGLTEVLIPIPVEGELVYLTSRGGLCLDSNKPSTSHLPGVDAGMFQHQLRDVPRVSREELDTVLDLMKELVGLVASFHGLERKLDGISASSSGTEDGVPDLTDWTHERLETELFRQALAKCDGNRLKAAKLINVPKSTFYRRIEQLGLTSE